MGVREESTILLTPFAPYLLVTLFGAELYCPVPMAWHLRVAPGMTETPMEDSGAQVW